jgi:hypothetical protein
MTALAGKGMADLDFCDFALLSGIVECFHAAGIDGSLAPGIAAGDTAESIDPAIE